MLLLLFTLGAGGGEPEPEPTPTGGGHGRLVGRRLGVRRPEPRDLNDDDELIELGIL